MGLAYNRTLEQSLIPFPPDGLEDGHPVLSWKRWVPRRARCVHKQVNKKVELKPKSVLLPSLISEPSLTLSSLTSHLCHNRDDREKLSFPKYCALSLEAYAMCYRRVVLLATPNDNNKVEKSKEILNISQSADL